MKYWFVLLVLFWTRQAVGQSTSVMGIVKDTDSPHGFPAATLLFQQGEATITGASTDSAGHFRVASINLGTYDVVIQALGFRTKLVRGVVVTANAAPLALSYPGPCTFLYTGSQRPACVGGHTDHLLPIVYGLPGKKALAQAKAGKIYLGGCQLTGCDPRYYCPLHQKEL